MRLFFSLRSLGWLLALLLPLATQAQVGVGTTTPAASAALEVKSTTGGLLLPRMTAAERAAIVSPVPGLLVFQTDGTPGLYYYIGTNWINLITSLIPNAIGAAGPNPGSVVSTLAGSNTGFANGTGTAAQFASPYSVAVDPSGTFVYVADRNNHRIRKVEISSGITTTLAGSTTGFADGTGTAAQFRRPTGVAVDPSGTFVYVADQSNHRIRKVEISSGATTTLAGSTFGFANGTGTAAQFSSPTGVTVDPSGTFVYVADQSNNRIRKVEISSGITTTLAGTGVASSANGTGTVAQFSAPTGVAVAPSGTIYVADQGNHRIRAIK